MPKGQLREVESRRNTLYVDSVVADTLISRVEDRLVINNSDIGTLNSRARRLNELKLENSIIAKANLKVVSKKFTVTCVKDVSKIDFLYIDGIYKNPKKAQIKLDKANVIDFKFNPDIKTELIVNMRYK